MLPLIVAPVRFEQLEVEFGEIPLTLGGGQARLRRGLVVAEIALCIVLLVGAGLMMRSFLAIYRADLTADAAHVVTASLRPPPWPRR